METETVYCIMSEVTTYYRDENDNPKTGKRIGIHSVYRKESKRSSIDAYTDKMNAAHPSQYKYWVEERVPISFIRDGNGKIRSAKFPDSIGYLIVDTLI
jgi:hypothetical protein